MLERKILRLNTASTDSRAKALVVDHGGRVALGDPVVVVVPLHCPVHLDFDGFISSKIAAGLERSYPVGVL